MVKGKYEYYGGENKIRFFAARVMPVNIAAENKALLQRLENY